jgi:hypothetical protein
MRSPHVARLAALCALERGATIGSITEQGKRQGTGVRNPEEFAATSSIAECRINRNV